MVLAQNQPCTPLITITSAFSNLFFFFCIIYTLFRELIILFHIHRCGGVMGKYAAGELKPPSVGEWTRLYVTMCV